MGNLPTWSFGEESLTVQVPFKGNTTFRADNDVAAPKHASTRQASAPLSFQ